MEAIEEITKTAAHMIRTISVVLYNSSKGNLGCSLYGVGTECLRLLYVVWLRTAESDVDICLLNVPGLIESAEWKSGMKEHYHAYSCKVLGVLVSFPFQVIFVIILVLLL